MWLKDLMGILGCDDRPRASVALRVTLHALRDRLTVEEAAQLAAQLPMLIRGFYYEGWDPTGKPLRERHLEQFLAAMEREYRRDRRVDLAPVARGVFTVRSKHITAGQIEELKTDLPSDIRRLC